MSPSPSLEQLVETQLARWAAAQDGPPSDLRRRPVITVSREHGALGGELARRLAERSGFELWDQALLQAVAARTGASERMLARFDERTRSGLQDMVAGMVYGVANTENEYVRTLAKVIHAVGLRGGAVVLGRGAGFVLAPAAALRVRVVAPLELRIARVAARRGLSDEAAEQEVRRVDQDRARFNQRSWARETRDEHGYDLVVNTAYLTVDGAVDVVGAAQAAKFPPSTEGDIRRRS